MSAKAPDRVAVIGAGTMGTGIALSFAKAGSSVRLMARRQSSLAAAQTRLEHSLSLLIENAASSTDEAQQTLRRVKTTTSLERAVEGASLVVESVFENVDVKHDVLIQCERAAGPTAIIGSDTSSIAIDTLAAALERPQRFAGFHWFNPAELVALVEVVSGARTAPETADRLLEWSRAAGKRPVHLRRDIEGFIANRIQYAVFREAFALVEGGVCGYAEVDEAMKAGLGARWAAIGPFESLDLAGLDVYEAVAARLTPSLASGAEPAAVVHEFLKDGALGCKSGRGLYGTYDDDAIERLARRRAKILLALERISSTEGEHRRSPNEASPVPPHS